MLGHRRVYGAQRHIRGAGVCSLLRELLSLSRESRRPCYILWTPWRVNQRMGARIVTPLVFSPPSSLKPVCPLPVCPCLLQINIFMEFLCSVCGRGLPVCVCVQEGCGQGRAIVRPGWGWAELEFLSGASGVRRGMAVGSRVGCACWCAG